ncbi:unnamed protein product [Cochlearia groenlandica]
MLIKKKLNCVSNGFDFTNIPKAPRSRKMKVSSKIDYVESHFNGIDLLASLAGKLLEDSESSSTSASAFQGDNLDHLCVKIKPEHGDINNNKPCKTEFYDHPASKSSSESTKESCLQFPSLEQEPVFDRKKGFGLTGLLGCESKNRDSDLLVESRSVSEETCVVNVDAGDNTKLVCRDDDENYCKYYKFSDKCKLYRPLTRVVHRRTKKSAMKRYGRTFPTSRCFDDTRTDGCLKSFHRKRKLCYGNNPWKHETTIYKKRRLSNKGLVSNSDGGVSSESVSNSPVKGDSVKFSIKSFRIPELFIEVPETATVGSLKRTVMEAVTSLLGDGIRIGVLVQGKKIRDDNNTLSQSGLSLRENLDSLGFTLEPGHEKPLVPLCSENLAISMPTNITNFSERSEASPALDSTILFGLQDAGNGVENNNQELVPYQSEISSVDEQHSPDSRALVPVSALASEPLAIVPLNEKPKRTEASQRRTRRPFSVNEVEALVHAVEEIGTGRWRDVKLGSFDSASHRTYVDLKDKWKTLVHTASIAPQQRRGEPVPQELLDRVLAAHRYWSEKQMKQNVKQQQVAATMLV